MNSLSTIIASIILMGVVVIFLGIGWILTGKSRLRGKGCGYIPSKDNKNNTCGTCGKTTSCKEEEENKEEK